MSAHKKFASSIDVARLAGVSQSAVSRTYKPDGKVSQETRRKVLEAADSLGYRPSLIPRIMLTHRSYLVAIAIGGIRHEAIVGWKGFGPVALADVRSAHEGWLPGYMAGV